MIPDLEWMYKHEHIKGGISNEKKMHVYNEYN